MLGLVVIGPAVRSRSSGVAKKYPSTSMSVIYPRRQSLAMVTSLSVVFRTSTKAVSASTRWATIPPPDPSHAEGLAGSNRKLRPFGSVPLPQSLIGIAAAELGGILVSSFAHTTLWILAALGVMDIGAMRLLQLLTCSFHFGVTMDMPSGPIMSIPMSIFARRPSTILAPREICVTAG